MSEPLERVLRAAGNILFRCDAGADIGFGHLKRCLALAGAFDDPAVTCRFAMVRPQPEACRLVEAAGYGVVELGAHELEGGAGLLDHLDGAHACIFDVAHHVSGDTQAAWRGVVDAVSKRRIVSVLIDGLGKHALVQDGKWALDALVVPYVGAPNRMGDIRLLSGPQYAVFDRAFLSARQKTIADQPARNVLLTFGGTDIKGLTVRTLKALMVESARNYAVRAVIGPGNDEDVVAEIERVAHGMDSVELVHSPSSLAEHMAWADMAVSATGLTKYELALTGTPAVLISIDQAHEDAHRPFENAHTALHLGQADQIGIQEITDAVDSLALNVDKRRRLSARGRELVDGLGAARIAKEVMRIHDA